MNTPQNPPSPRNFWKWFNPLGRDIGGLAFILNRITALGLTFYLFMHLIVLAQLSRGPEAYDGFLALIHHPLYIFGELLVVAAVFIHGLNGIRVVLTSFGIGVTTQKQLFVGLMAVSLVVTVVFAIRMFGG